MAIGVNAAFVSGVELPALPKTIKDNRPSVANLHFIVFISPCKKR
jgi:hypothetical protein